MKELTVGWLIPNLKLHHNTSTSLFPSTATLCIDYVDNSNLGQRNVQETSNIFYHVLPKELIHSETWNSKGNNNGLLGNNVNFMLTSYDEGKLPSILVKVVGACSVCYTWNILIPWQSKSIIGHVIKYPSSSF